jgi:hypothetical protein
MIQISTLIATTAEIKVLLNISATTYDDAIELWNPLLQDDLLNNILKNNFGTKYDLTNEEIVQPVFPHELQITMSDYMREKVINPMKLESTGQVVSNGIKSFALADYSVTYNSEDLESGVNKKIFANAKNKHEKTYADEPVKTVVGA